MSDDIAFGVAPTKTAPVAGIELVEPRLVNNFSKCEANMHIGLFFDGTKNNRDYDTDSMKHSNIARLYDAYFEDTAQGCYRQYVPGVGTPFQAIGEDGWRDLGSGFAIGCEERVLFALLTVLDFIHQAAFTSAPMFNSAQIKALCRNQSGMAASLVDEDHEALARLGLFGGLRLSNAGDERAKTLLSLARKLEMKLVDGRPHIKECFIDVFGFSRGAAQARVFCNWLDQILVGGKLAGIIIHLRFLGIMDTVASAGFWSTIGAAALGSNGGHSGWADAGFLRIPKSVNYCVHMVAMHELRKNFPLDTVTVDAKLPTNCREFAYPGAHSDVGGGYLPNELGISVGKDLYESDALKLAQIPLNHMLECARAAGVPLNKKRAAAVKAGYDPFAIAPRLHAAFNQFLDRAKMTARPLHEWLQPYLNWRWDRRLAYASLAHVRRASAADRKLLLAFNDHLCTDAALLDRTAQTGLLTRVANIVLPTANAQAKVDAVAMGAFDAEARSILKIARAMRPDDCLIFHAMFDDFVHDSMAGFDHCSFELTGYWRYRKGYLGRSDARIVSNDDASKVEKAA